MDGVNSTKQRLQACLQDIQQLDKLRAKHKQLMEQLRRDYPSMRSFVKSIDSDDSDDGSPPIYSHQVSGSTDSGFDQQKSSDQPMTYSTFRKMSLEDRHDSLPKGMVSTGHIVENTLKNLTTQLNTAAVLPSANWSSRIRAKGALDGANRPRSCYGNVERENANSRPASLIVSSKRGSRILDSSTFAQLTPPPVTRKFATVQPPLSFEGPVKAQVKPMPKRSDCVLKPKPVSPLSSQKLQMAQLFAGKQPLDANNNKTAAPLQFSTSSLEKRPVSTTLPSIKPFRWSSKAEGLDSPHSTVEKPRFGCFKRQSIASEEQIVRPNPIKTATIVNPDRWNRAIASVAPTPQVQPPSGPPPTPRTKPPSSPFASHREPAGFTTNCSIAISVPSRNPDRPLIRMRRHREWHESENL